MAKVTVVFEDMRDGASVEAIFEPQINDGTPYGNLTKAQILAAATLKAIHSGDIVEISEKVDLTKYAEGDDGAWDDIN